MPELPEVEVIRAGLEPAVTGAEVRSVEIFDGRSLRRHRGPAEDFVDRLTGRTLALPRRRGKFLWIPLAPMAPAPRNATEKMSDISDPDAGPVPEARNSVVFGADSEPTEALVVHLGMSGQVLLRQPGAEDKQTRIRIELQHPQHGALRLNFADQRIFGSMAIDDLLPDKVPGDTVPSQVAHIARDPLDPLFGDAAFISGLARRRTGVKRALLDQTLISGIGNIYADEALWAARIHYDQPTQSLSRPRAKLLLAEVRAVLAKALDEGGTSFDAQYVNVNGASGYFSHSLNAYGRHGQPCARCSRPLVRDSFMNRGSHYCAFCQRVRAAKVS
jgi:formamidopyrimidine-DNA glycosylase